VRAATSRSPPAGSRAGRPPSSAATGTTSRRSSRRFRPPLLRPSECARTSPREPRLLRVRPAARRRRGPHDSAPDRPRSAALPIMPTRSRTSPSPSSMTSSRSRGGRSERGRWSPTDEVPSLTARLFVALRPCPARAPERCNLMWTSVSWLLPLVGTDSAALYSRSSAVVRGCSAPLLSRMGHATRTTDLAIRPA
jgi:hypothetical protein